MIICLGISFFFLIAYLFFVHYLMQGWRLVANTRNHSRKDLPSAAVSLIIPVRNGRHELLRLLQALDEQIWQPNVFEIVVVDDHSTEQIADISSLYPQLPLSYCRLPDGQAGKKDALLYGVQISHHDLLLFTDADTIPVSGWLQSMVKECMATDADMLIGPVLVHPGQNRLQRFEQLDMISLVATAAATTGQNNPILCNGANLACTRDVFMQHHKEGATHISGDDVFLLLSLKKESKRKIRFNAAQEAIVHVAPAESLARFVNQRIRWASKSRGYKDASIILIALLVWGYSVFLLLLALFSFAEPALLIVFVGLFLVKTRSDYLLFKKVADFFQLSLSPISLTGFELVYIVYVSFVGTFAHIIPFRWKGRKIRS